MANYHTEFSFAVPMSPEQAKLTMNFANAVRALYDGETEALDPKAWPEGMTEGIDTELHGFGLELAYENNELSVISEDGGNVEWAVDLLQRVMRAFTISGIWGFEWANTCSKPRSDGFGGGSVAFTATDTKWQSTSDALVSLTESLKSSSSTRKIWSIQADTVGNGMIEDIAYSEASADRKAAAILAPIWKKHRGDEPMPAIWRDAYERIYDKLEDWISVTEHDISDHPGFAPVPTMLASLYCLVIVDETGEIGISFHADEAEARSVLMSDLYECYQDYDLPQDDSDQAICEFLNENQIKQIYTIRPVALDAIFPQAAITRGEAQISAFDELEDARQGRALLQIKIAAIAARIQGIWDHPALLAFEPVLGGHRAITDDVVAITRAYLHPDTVARAHKAWDESGESVPEEDDPFGV